MMRAALLSVVLLVACSNAVATHTASGSRTGRTSPTVVPGGLATGGVIEYRVPDPPSLPPDCGPCPPSLGTLTLGPDGNIWYVDVVRSQVGRVTPGGQILQFPVPNPIGGAQTIAGGPDGNIWITARGSAGGSDWIVRITPDGAVTKFAAGGPNTAPESITAGPDGNLWFTEVFGNAIGRMTPSGTVTQFPIPGGREPRGIVKGPDGNLWFTLSAGVGRITTRGMVTVYPIAQDPGLIGGDITVGPDGDLWFAGLGGIGRITPRDGKVSTVPLPQDSRPRGLVSGPDQNIWFADAGTNAIARLGVTGTIREFRLPRRDSSPLGVTVGADRRIWFTEADGGRIGSIGERVPEATLKPRVLSFDDSSQRTAAITNTGDTALAISSIRVTGVDSGLFAVGDDGCSRRSLAAGGTCSVTLRYAAGGPGGVQSAFLEIADDGTGTPQRLSLVAQLPNCQLPVVVPLAASTIPQGDLLDVRSAQLLGGSGGGFEGPGAASGVRTTVSPVLTGPAPGYFDRPAGRWLPVSSAAAVSPDGSRFAYSSFEAPGQGGVHVVEVATGFDRVLAVPQGFWVVVAFTGQGIYLHQAYEGTGPGLYLLDPDTDAWKTVFTDATVAAVDGAAAWIEARNPADALPPPPTMGAAYNEIERRDLVTGATTPWFYRPGNNLWVIAVANGAPVISAFDGTAISYWFGGQESQAERMEFPFALEAYPSFSGFIGDAAGVWVGGSDGVYLWTPRTGGVLVAEAVARPAGNCA